MYGSAAALGRDARAAVRKDLAAARQSLLWKICGGEPGIIAQTRMRIERQMRTVDGEVVFDEQPEQFVFLARPRMRL